MKTEQEIMQMVDTCGVYHSCALCPYNPEDLSRYIGDKWKGGCPNCDKKLVYAMGKGYGDVSEYKPEIERLKSENEKLKTKCDDLKKLSDWQREEIKILKAEVNKGCDNCETIKQGQVDVLKELKTRHDYAIKNMGYPWDISQQIDELIKEIEK